jgi:hypothetical protein
MASDIECVFTPKVEPSAYTINIANDIMLTLTLNPKKSCVRPLSRFFLWRPWRLLCL